MIVALPIIVASLAPGARASAAPGDGQPSGEIAAVDDGNFPEIKLIVRVLDSTGKPVIGLRPRDIVATENGRPAEVGTVGTVLDEKVGIAVVLAIDASGSMAGPSIDQSKAAAKTFAETMTAVDELAVLSFANDVNVLQELTNDRVRGSAALERLRAAGNTALYKAVVDSVATAGASTLPRKAVILLTDGEDFGGVSKTTRAASEDAVRASGVPVYTIALGQDVDLPYLTNLATLSGGLSFRAPTPSDIPGIYEQLRTRLRSDYVVTLRTAGTLDSATRNLSLKIQTPEGLVSVDRVYTLSKPLPSAATPVLPEVAAEAPQSHAPTRPAEKHSSTLLIGLGFLVTALMVATVVWYFYNARREKEVALEVGSLTARARTLMKDPAPAPPPSQNVARLRVTVGPQTGTTFMVRESPMTLGSSSSCEVRLEDGPGLQAIHARTWWRDDRLMLHHLGREGKTIVGGREVSWTSLDQDDLIEIGPHTLVVESLSNQNERGTS